MIMFFFFFSSRRRHTRSDRDWSSDVCSSDLGRSILEREAGDLSWINHTGLDQVAELISFCVEAEVFILRLAHASYNQRAFVPGVLCNLANGFFERTLYDVHPNGFIVVELELLQGRQAAQESSAPARDNT